MKTITLLKKAREAIYEAIPNLSEHFEREDIDEFLCENIKLIRREKDNALGNILADALIDDFNEFRRCSSCGEIMTEGYCLDGGSYYCCSDECMHDIYIGIYGAQNNREAEKMYLCDYYCLDYNDYKEKLNTIPRKDWSSFLDSEPGSADVQSDYYYTMWS